MVIDHVEKWIEFLNARNLTSHTYNESTANEVYAIAKDFLAYAKKLSAA